MALAVVSSGNSQSTSFAFDAGSGDRRWLFVNVGTHDASAPLGEVTGITYAGAAMTPLASALESYAGGGQEVRHTTWALEAPATGSNTLTVTLSAVVNSICVVAVVFSDCGGPGPNTAALNGNISDITLNVTTTEATSLVLGSWRGNSARGVAPGSGVTLVDAVSGGTDIWFIWAGSKAASGGADSWQITLATATRSAATAVEVLEDTGGGGPEPTEGVLSRALETATVEAVGTVLVAGVVDESLGALALTSSGQVAIAGTLTATLDGATLEAAGALEGAPIEGVLAVTLADLTGEAAGRVDIAGAVGAELAALTVDAGGAVEVAGSVTSTLDALQLEATGAIGEAPRTGALDVTLASLTAVAAGELLIAGALDASLQSLALESAGTVLVEGALTVTLAGLVLSAAGGEEVTEPRSLTLRERRFAPTLRPRTYTLAVSDRRP